MLFLLPLYTEKNVFPLKLLQWVKDRASETQDNKHVIGQNLSEAEALFSEHQELEAKLKVRSPPSPPLPPSPPKWFFNLVDEGGVYGKVDTDELTQTRRAHLRAHATDTRTRIKHYETNKPQYKPTNPNKSTDW